MEIKSNLYAYDVIIKHLGKYVYMSGNNITEKRTKKGYPKIFVISWQEEKDIPHAF